MNLAEVFIRRPVMTTLISLAIVIFGLMAYRYAAGQRSAQRRLSRHRGQRLAARREPRDDGVVGRDPAGAAVLDHRRPRPDDLDQSCRAQTSITLAVRSDRNLDAAAQDVQAAIAATQSQLPQGMPSPPSYKKVNPADQPVLYLSLSSTTLPLSQGRRICRDLPRRAHLDDQRRRAGAGVRLAEVRGAHPGRSQGAGLARNRHRRGRAGGRRRQRQSADRNALRRASGVHRAGQRPAHQRGGVPAADRRLPQRLAGAAARRGPGDRQRGERQGRRMDRRAARGGARDSAPAGHQHGRGGRRRCDKLLPAFRAEMPAAVQHHERCAIAPDRSAPRSTTCSSRCC